VKDLNNGQKAIFDPSYPFIYMGEADFLAFAGKAKTIWPTAFLTDNVCEIKQGTCFIERSCDAVREEQQNDNLDYTFKLSVNGDNDVDTVLTIDMASMLMTAKDENKTEICVLPFYQLNKD